MLNTRGFGAIFGLEKIALFFIFFHEKIKSSVICSSPAISVKACQAAFCCWGEHVKNPFVDVFFLVPVCCIAIRCARAAVLVYSKESKQFPHTVVSTEGQEI